MEDKDFWLTLEEARRLLEEAERRDAEEDERLGRERRGDELPKGLRDPRSRMNRIKKALERVEGRGQGIGESRPGSLTPDTELGEDESTELVRLREMGFGLDRGSRFE